MSTPSLACNNANWLPIPRYEDADYEICSAGIVRNRNSKKTVKNYQRATGNIVVNFAYHGRRIERSLDRLVAEAFIENPNNHPLVNHIDGDLSNCSADNLEWIPDNRAYLEAKSRGFGDKPDDYYNVWYPLAEFPDSPYEINKMGQLRNKRTGELVKPQLNKTGYLQYTIFCNKYYYCRCVHALVANQFIPNPLHYTVINHIDENKQNPCCDNLEWVDQRTNVTHGTAPSKAAANRQKPIDEYDLSGHYIRTWASTRSIYTFYGIDFAQHSNAAYFGRILKQNDAEDTLKTPFGECVFFHYDGLCKDKAFNVKEKKARSDKYNFKHVDTVPIQFLYEDKRVFKYLKILEQLSHRANFNEDQINAFQYGIICIRKKYGLD